MPCLAIGGEMMPAPGGSDVTTTDTWNKWDTQNFIILSLNNQQGEKLSEQIEPVKSWVLKRWGLSDITFSKKCKIICVPDLDTMKKLFRVNKSYAEVRRSQEGQSSESMCWFICDETAENFIPMLVTYICLKEYEEQQGIKIQHWAHRGIAILNGNVTKVQSFLSPLAPHIANNEKIFFSKPLFTLTNTSKSEYSNLYDQEVALLCLMIRKEFGQRKFLMLITDGSEQNLYRVLGYKTYSEFDSALKRYFFYAANDMRQTRMPLSYFNVTPIQRGE